MRRILCLFATALLFMTTACANQEEKSATLNSSAHKHEEENYEKTDQEKSEHHEGESEDIKIGQTVTNGMEINAVYIPHMIKVAPNERGGQNGNIHLEADIHATKDNTFGFHEGEWIPYLTIAYEIHNLDTHEKINGQLYPMVAGDAHYASNILIPKSGNYELTYEISPPDLSRHTEDVKEFYDSMKLKWKFNFDINKLK